MSAKRRAQPAQSGRIVQGSRHLRSVEIRAKADPVFAKAAD